MNDGDAILKAVIEEPDDPLHRLAYADWLEDRGGPCDLLRASAIRGDDRGGPVPCDCGQCFREARRLAEAEYAVRPGGTHAFFSRGFCVEVVCSVATWLQHGSAVANAHPLRRVTLHGKRPFLYPDGVPHPYPYSFDRSDRPTHYYQLPPAIWCELAEMRHEFEGVELEGADADGVYFTSASVALDCLSLACIRWARKETCK